MYLITPRWDNPLVVIIYYRAEDPPRMLQWDNPLAPMVVERELHLSPENHLQVMQLKIMQLSTMVVFCPMVIR